MRNILLICHVEPEFDQSLTLEKLANKIRGLANLYHSAIVIQFNYTDMFYSLADLPIKREWMYGYDPEFEAEEDGHVEDQDYIRVSTAHGYALIEDWMKQLRKTDRYTLVGGSRWECLQDVYEILEHLGLTVKINENYCYGI